MAALWQLVMLQVPCSIPIRLLLTHGIDNLELKSKLDHIILNMAVILAVINSNKKVNVPVFSEFCLNTSLLVKSVSWIHIIPSAHVVLAHSAELIEGNNQIGLLNFTQCGLEANNKFLRQYRINYSVSLTIYRTARIDFGTRVTPWSRKHVSVCIVRIVIPKVILWEVVWTTYLCPKWNYAQFSVFGPKCPNMEIRPQTPEFWEFLNNYNIFRFHTHHFPSNEPSTTSVSLSKVKLCPIQCFRPKMPKYGNSAPDPWIQLNVENFWIFRC